VRAVIIRNSTIHFFFIISSMIFVLVLNNKVSLYKYSDPVNRLFVFYGNIFKIFLPPVKKQVRSESELWGERNWHTDYTDCELKSVTDSRTNLVQKSG
jgi:hypothetical protein